MGALLFKGFSEDGLGLFEELHVEGLREAVVDDEGSHHFNYCVFRLLFVLQQQHEVLLLSQYTLNLGDFLSNDFLTIGSSIE